MIENCFKRKVVMHNSLLNEKQTTYYFLLSETINSPGVMIVELNKNDKTDYQIKLFGVQEGIYMTDYQSSTRNAAHDLYNWFSVLSQHKLQKILETVK